MNHDKSIISVGRRHSCNGNWSSKRIEFVWLASAIFGGEGLWMVLCNVISVKNFGFVQTQSIWKFDKSPTTEIFVQNLKKCWLFVKFGKCVYTLFYVLVCLWIFSLFCTIKKIVLILMFKFCVHVDDINPKHFQSSK